jgi:hypothetical protein
MEHNVLSKANVNDCRYLVLLTQKIGLFDQTRKCVSNSYFFDVLNYFMGYYKFLTFCIPKD